MFFDFLSFINELRNDDSKKDTILNYENSVQSPIPHCIEDCTWYKEYISLLPTIDCYNTPEELKNNFDWSLLFRLAIGSASTNCSLYFKEDTGLSTFHTELSLSVISGSTCVTQDISTLWIFQIQRLYEIYIEEQLNLFHLKYTDPSERKAIEDMQEQRLASARILLSQYNKKKVFFNLISQTR